MECVLPVPDGGELGRGGPKGAGLNQFYDQRTEAAAREAPGQGGGPLSGYM